MRTPPLLIAAALCAGALAIPAWSASTPPQLTSFSATSLRAASGGVKVAVSGTIDCTAKAHYNVWVWAYQSSRGALAHTLYPASAKHLSKKQQSRRLRMSTCSGAVEKWSVKSHAEGRHPARFVAGPAQVCTTVTVSHSRRYVLQSTCTNVTIP